MAAEGDLIGRRMTGSESDKLSVLPAVLDGEPETALPPLLQGRVYADFRDPETYFLAAFDLILGVHGLSARDPLPAELRASIADPMR